MVNAHGTITRVIGANGVVMPGLTSRNISGNLNLELTGGSP